MMNLLLQVKNIESSKNILYIKYNDTKINSNMIEREIFNEVRECLEKKKVAVIFGTRRVGKTTLIREVIKFYENQGKKYLFIDCESARWKRLLDTTDDQILGDIVRGVNLLAVDEAQNIETIGKTFDPELHEAVSSIQDDTKGEKEIVQEYRKGYKIGDRVIRHSMVVVAN